MCEMTNEELQDAILKTKDMLLSTKDESKLCVALYEHLTTLLDIQATRAAYTKPKGLIDYASTFDPRGNYPKS